MGRVTDMAEALWTGAETTETHNPVATFLGLEEMADGVAFVSSFGNVSAFETGDGLVVVDTGSFATGAIIAAAVRTWSDAPLHTVVYTHGHVDHVCGVDKLDETRLARVVSHARVPARFDRYVATAGYNAAINARQFRTPGLRWPTEYRYPDEVYTDALDLEVGGTAFQLRHDRGETDDHTWVYLPERKVLCTGDLFIWASPNCGNPQKVQRYPREWADALDKMAGLDVELLLPGHGLPIVGAARVRQALTDTAALLRTVHDQALALMNQGARLDEVLRGVTIPTELLARPYLRPVYDDPMFIVRNIWRLYGGWYDGNPARLQPPADRTLAEEVSALAGGAEALAGRAREVAEGGDLATAAQLAEWAYAADAAAPGVRETRADVYRRRADAEPSLMAKSIYLAAAEEREEDA